MFGRELPPGDSSDRNRKHDTGQYGTRAPPPPPPPPPRASTLRRLDTINCYSEHPPCAVSFSTIVNASIANNPGIWEQLNSTIVVDDTATPEEGNWVFGRRVSGAVERVALADIAVEDFKDYLDTFRDAWNAYKSNGRYIGKRAGNEETESVYQVVPPMYFSPDFGLERHEVFKQSLIQTMDEQEEMQNQLQKCLDLVEGRLFEQIELAHEEKIFENLLPNFEEIQTCVERAVEATRTYRAKLQEVKRDRLDAALRTCFLSRKRERIREVMRRMELIKHVSMAPPAIQMLLSTQDFITALDLLENSIAVLNSEDGALKGVSCVKPIAAKLAELEDKFDSTLQAEFVTKTCDIFLSNNPESPHSLENVTACLFRRKILDASITQSLRDVLLTKLKRFLKQRVAAEIEVQKQQAPTPEVEASEDKVDGEKAEDDEQVVTEPLSECLQRLTYPQFLLFWEEILTNVALRLAKRVETWNAMVAKTMENALKQSPQSPTNAYDAHLDLSLSRLFDVVMTTCLQKVGSILQARQAEHARLTYVEWNRILSRTNERLDRIRAVQQRTRPSATASSVGGVDVGSSLRNVLYMQTKALLEEFHQNRVAEVHLLLGEEKWDAVPLSAETRRHLNIIQDGKTKTPEESANEDSRHLEVGTTSYLVVHSGLQLLRIMCDYIEFCTGLPSITMECMQRLNHLLKLFNKQVSSLILGGAAVQKQILKKITAANLALCSQSCGMIGALIPEVKERLVTLFLRIQGQSQGAISERMVSTIVSDLEATTNSFAEHKDMILQKLGAILVDRYDVHAKKWFSIPHSPPPDSLESVLLPTHDSLESFAKDLSSMYKVLFKYLSGDEVQRIFSTSYAEISEKFKKSLEDLGSQEDAPVYTAANPVGDRFLHDVATLSERLGVLNGIVQPNNLFLSGLVMSICQILEQRTNRATLEFLQQKNLLPIS